MKVTELLRQLVAVPSDSGNESEVAALAVDTIANEGLDVVSVGNSVIARVERGSGPTLLLASHLDTVPVGDGWTQPALGADWADGRLFGRGSNDAKASVAAMISALVELAGTSGWNGQIWLGLCACEETNNSGMAALLDHVGSHGSIDGAVVGEPTGLQVARAQSGLAVLRATWSGRSCHAAHVERVEHENALLTAASEITATAPYLVLDGEHPLLGRSTIATTVLHAGERHNVVPDRAVALFDARLAPPHGSAAAVAALERALPSARIEVKSDRLRPFETAEDHPLVQAALRVAGRSAALGSPTLSDMALLQGIPAVKCGPGETARSHTPDEFVLATELEAGATFYRSFAPAVLDALAGTEVTS